MCFVVDLTRTVSKKRNMITGYFLFIRHFIWVFAEKVWPFPGLFKHCLIVYKITQHICHIFAGVSILSRRVPLAP